MSCASSDFAGDALPSPAPRSSSYMLMLNSFASDLDSILSDLSTSPTLRGSQELIGLDPQDIHVAASCPNLTAAFPVFDVAQKSEDVVDSSEISLLERLIRSHPIWYLPNVQRVAAAQLLHNQEQGVFITRQSSQPGTLALSVKLTPQAAPLEPGSRLSLCGGIGAGVQHYLIEAAETPQHGVRLESSDFVFDNLPALLAHYCQCCDELPVRLKLPAKIRESANRQSLTSLALLGQEFWNSGENILTIPSKRTPPVPPFRLSTFDPFGSSNQLATTPEERPKPSLSPRLEARGSEPVPPPPPPRWCKPKLVQTEDSPEKPNEEPIKQLPPVAVRKRRRARRRRSSAPLSPHCHHSSLADKASDYEDLWGTAGSEEEDPGTPREEEKRSSSSDSSSSWTLEKMTSVSSNVPASRSLTSSPEVPDEPAIEPPEAFQQNGSSITIIEITGEDVVQLEIKQADSVENKENVPDDVPVRRRTSCSSTESRGEVNSRRTSPLYSEPADALPPQAAGWNKTRALPLPPGEFTTFTKDGYVRCTLPALASNQSNPKVLPPTGQPASRAKQISLPKPPRHLPPAGPADQRKAFPSTMYLPTTTDDSLTIQEVLTALYPLAALPVPSPPPPMPRSIGTSQLTKQRVSAYDNLLSGSAGDLEEHEEPEDGDSSDEGTVTEFSEPWDSARWDRLLSSPSSSLRGKSTGSGRRKRSNLPKNAGSSNSSDGGFGTLSDSNDPAAAKPPIPPLLHRTRSFKDKMDPLLASPRLLALRSTCNSQAGRNLQVLILQLGRDCTTTFGRSLQNFLL